MLDIVKQISLQFVNKNTHFNKHHSFELWMDFSIFVLKQMWHRFKELSFIETPVEQ